MEQMLKQQMQWYGVINVPDIGLSGEVLSIRDLWEHTDISINEMLDVNVKRHCTKVYRVKATQCIPVENKDDLEDDILNELKRVSYEDITSLLENGAKLIDVRSQEEYAQYHSAGKRSTQARNLLVYLGYKNVYLLTGHESVLLDNM